jgi:hypothetical protein
LTVGLVVGVTRCKQLGVGEPPRTAVTGNLEFWNHSNPSDTSVLDDVTDVSLFVHFRDGMVSALFAQLGVGATHVRKTLVVGDMPMQNVEFVVSHSVQNLQDNVDGLEMPRSVQENSSMGESREVDDSGGLDNELQEIQIFAILQAVLTDSPSK